MPKSEEVLYLDPWAAALERKEKIDKEAEARLVTPDAPRREIEDAPRKLDAQEDVRLDAKTSATRRASGKHKTRKGQVNVQPDPALLKEVQHFLTESGLNMKEFFERASRHYLDSASSRVGAGASSFLVHDDVMIWAKTDDAIIRLYTSLTGNKWKPADDRCARQFNEADRRLIEIGILNTLLNAKGKKINSFAYFIPEIDECLAVQLGDETIEIMLPRRRAQWAKMKGK